MTGERARPAVAAVAGVALDPRVLVAGVFFGVWLVAVIADWFWHPEGSLVPAWFQALGVLCLGYLLGIDLIETVRRGTRW